uniref:RING-type E3 ubiquitin transferase n=1 Tax=Panagrellus redivivus TaxID=6233 RepID=A0A7E4W205_PANRE
MSGRRRRQDSEEPGPSTASRRRRQDSSEPGPSTSRTRRRQASPKPTSSTRRRRSSSVSVSPEPCSSTDVVPKRTTKGAAPRTSSNTRGQAKPATATKKVTIKDEKDKDNGKKEAESMVGDVKTGKTVPKSKEAVLKCAVPVYFKDPKAPPMVMHMQEIHLVDSVDEMYEHYKFNALAKMECHTEALRADIEDINYLNAACRSQKRDMTKMWNDHLMPSFFSIAKISQLYRVFFKTLSRNLILRFDTTDIDVYHENRMALETAKSGVLTAGEPVLVRWRQNNVFTIMGSKILVGIFQLMANCDSPDLARYDAPQDPFVKQMWEDESSQRVMQQLYQSLSENGFDGIIKTLFEYLDQMSEQLDGMPKRFIRRFYNCKNVVSTDVVKNDLRRAEDDYAYFVGLVNMQIEENQMITDEVFTSGCEIMPEYEARMKKEARRKSNQGKVSKISIAEVSACRKEIAKAKAAVAVADKELWQLMDQMNGYHEQKLRHRYIEKYNRLMALGRQQKAFRRHLRLVQMLRKQKRYAFHSLKSVKQQVEDNLFEIMEMSAVYFDRIIMTRKLAGAEKHEALKKEWEELQDERKKLHREFVILSATAKHHYPTAQKQLGEHFAAVRENIVCVTNPKLNHIAEKKALLEKVRRDEQEAKYYNRHSFVVPCPLPNRLRPPFSNLEHERQQVRQMKAMASQSAPAICTTLQALSDPSQNVRRDVLKRAMANETPTSTRRTSPKGDITAKPDSGKPTPVKSSSDKAVVEKPLPPSSAKASTSTPNVPFSSHRSERRRSRTPPRRHDVEKERESEKAKETRPRTSTSYSDRERAAERVGSEHSRSRDTRDARREPERHRPEGSRSFHEDRRDRDDRDQRPKAEAVRPARTDESRVSRTETSRSRDEPRSRDEAFSRNPRDDYSRTSSRRVGRDEPTSRPVRDDRSRSLRDDDKRDADRRTRHLSPDERSRKRQFESPERGFKRPSGGVRSDYDRKDRDDRDRRDKDDRDRSRDYRGSRSSVTETEAKRPRREEDQSSSLRSDNKPSYRTPSKETVSRDPKNNDKVSRSSSSSQKAEQTTPRKHGESTPRKYEETTPRKATESTSRKPVDVTPRKLGETTPRKHEESTPRKAGESSRSKDSKKISSETAPTPKKSKVETPIVDEKAAISTNEIDDLLEETFEPPKPKERKHLTLEEINQFVRDNRAVELGKMNSEQREKFLRSVLPSQDRRPIYFPEAIGHPSNMDAYMKSRGFDVDNDPPDAPWRKAMEVFTTKHYLKHVNQSLQRQLRNHAQTDLMNPLVYPIEIPRQIHINNKLAKGQTDEFKKKKKFNANLLKAKTATATECFKILGSMKDVLSDLHEAEDTDLANFTEQARVQNELRYVEDRVSALRRWNDNLRDRKNAFTVGNIKHEKMLATLGTIDNVADTEVSNGSSKAQTIAEKIAEKRRLIEEKKAELAATAKKKEALMEVIVEKDKMVRETKTKLKLARRQLKDEKALAAELEELHRPALEEQQIIDYYSSIVMCRMCKRVPVDAGFKKCLHLYCRDCLTKYMEKSGPKKCPVCNIRVTMKDYTRIFL